jgi:uncharacterized membrane protein YebE (DUF533 family)
MADSKTLDVIRMWAAVAWADGTLADREADGLRKLIAAADLSAEDREAALAMLAERVYMPDGFAANLTTDVKRGIYGTACRMAALDRVFATAERVMLDRLRFQLQIDDVAADEVERDVPGLG